MVGIIIRPSFWFRRAVILAAAAALVLPLPARCASCAAGASDCSHCRVANSDAMTAAAARQCCQRHAVVRGTVDFEAIDCDRIQTRTCGCWFSPVERTNAPADRQLIVPDVFAAVPATLPRLDDAANGEFPSIAEFGDLPPPVPHRALHCSWII
jgi:hypothetical protein